MWILLAACSGPSDRDADGDGFAASTDCDDGDAFVHPGAGEFCDGRDDDCDGIVDGPSPLGTAIFTTDADGDRFGDPAGDTFEGCDPGPGWAREATDCDDADPAVHPRQADGCNGVDDDCDGVIDGDPPVDRWADDDGDGHGDPSRPVRSCVATARDPDDCDDTNPDSFPDAPERCDGEDNDCDGRPDSFDATVDLPTWYADLDGDGYGIEEFPLVACVPPNPSWALAAGDCDDFDPSAHPGALQLCTPADTDCDGTPGGGVSGWWDPAWPVRVSLSLTATAGSSGAVGTGVVDFRAARDAVQIGTPFDPATLVVVVQDCAVGAVALPTAFVDGMGDPFAPGDPADPIGDERGLVTFRLDRPLAAGETLALAAYFGGSATPPVGGALTTAVSLDTSAFSATFDPDRAGTLDALAIGGVRAVSQADAREGNGVLGDGGWTRLGPAATAVVADTPLFGAVEADGIHDGPAGPVRYGLWWFAWDGVPALYTKILLEATGPLTVDEVRPFELVPLDLVDPVGTTGPVQATLTDGTTGVALGWVTPPLDPESVTCDDDGCRVVASEGQTGLVAAGERLVDHRVLALVALGPGEGPGAVAAVLPSTVLTVGSAELP